MEIVQSLILETEKIITSRLAACSLQPNFEHFTRSSSRSPWSVHVSLLTSITAHISTLRFHSAAAIWGKSCNFYRQFTQKIKPAPACSHRTLHCTKQCSHEQNTGRSIYLVSICVLTLNLRVDNGEVYPIHLRISLHLWWLMLGCVECVHREHINPGLTRVLGLGGAQLVTYSAFCLSPFVSSMCHLLSVVCHLLSSVRGWKGWPRCCRVSRATCQQPRSSQRAELYQKREHVSRVTWLMWCRALPRPQDRVKYKLDIFLMFGLFLLSLPGRGNISVLIDGRWWTRDQVSAAVLLQIF